jgi:hypothetical protein
LLSREHINHKKLDYTFVHKEIKIPEEKEEYKSILRQHKIDIVLDLTDMETLPLFKYTDSLGISYVNTALNDDNLTIAEIAELLYPQLPQLHHSPHILCAGMNPGIVNAWVREGIEKYGMPKSITHFEYDTSMIKESWRPLITWSIHEFLVEAFRDQSGRVHGRKNLEVLHPNGLMHKVNMQSILEPIMKLDAYPDGFQILHEENLTIGEKYNVPTQFVYAIHPKTMKHLVQLYNQKGDISEKDLILGENIEYPLTGSDSIGVLLQYADKDVYYFNTVKSEDLTNISATYFQVIMGVLAALKVLLNGELQKGTYFTEDLYNTSYHKNVFSLLVIEEFVFPKIDIAEKVNSDANRLQNNL